MADKMNPYLTTNHGVLFNQDCLEILGSMRSQSIDLKSRGPCARVGSTPTLGTNKIKGLGGN